MTSMPSYFDGSIAASGVSFLASAWASRLSAVLRLKTDFDASSSFVVFDAESVGVGGGNIRFLSFSKYV